MWFHIKHILNTIIQSKCVNNLEIWNSIEVLIKSHIEDLASKIISPDLFIQFFFLMSYQDIFEFKLHLSLSLQTYKLRPKVALCDNSQRKIAQVDGLQYGTKPS